MTTLTLVYPYFHPHTDSSIFRFPPLGLGYIAAYLGKHGISVQIIDCTFLKQDEALKRIIDSKPRIIGIQSMYSMKEKTLELAKHLRPYCELLVAGGALVTTEPSEFLDEFDVAVIGEGEVTMLELINGFIANGDISKVNGIAFREKVTGKIKKTPSRELHETLDDFPNPERKLFENKAYQNYYKKNFGYTTTAIMSSRGCPFSCDFCSKPVFGSHFRARAASKVVDEVEEAIALGYSRIWFGDDCFTLKQERLFEICEEIIQRGLKISWECLSRVDTLDETTVKKMKQAGCLRMFFGIESGDISILALMKKQITIKQVQNALSLCKSNGIQAGAFFIIGYPGESDKTVLTTLKFASTLPLEYLSFTMPYPIPGTTLYEKLFPKIINDEWKEPKNINLVKHKLLFISGFSERKLKFAIIKGMGQFYVRKHLGRVGYAIIGFPFEYLTDAIFRLLN
jgi:anaerobic magnesium-protoporphyrin IX monomethyl ester cyclase